jgi:hypothetical protein
MGIDICGALPRGQQLVTSAPASRLFANGIIVRWFARGRKAASVWRKIANFWL